MDPGVLFLVAESMHTSMHDAYVPSYCTYNLPLSQYSQCFIQREGRPGIQHFDNYEVIVVKTQLLYMYKFCGDKGQADL